MFGLFKSKKSLPSKHRIPSPTEDFTHPEPILKLFTTLTGIHFKNKEPIVNSKLIHFSRHRHIFSFRELYSRLQSEPELLQELINYLTVNETYFFREVKQIDYMVQKILKQHGRFRVLCAPGSTGEEPYSIAISLLNSGIDPNRIEIVSIDINSEAIERAKQGIYSTRALHKTSTDIEQRYFIIENNQIYVRDDVKKLVSFHVVNVFDHNQLYELGKFDYIFSRNMLIYFDSPVANMAIKNLSGLARSSETLFFFGHADILTAPPSMNEHYDNGTRFYTRVF